MKSNRVNDAVAMLHVRLKQLYRCQVLLRHIEHIVDGNQYYRSGDVTLTQLGAQQIMSGIYKELARTWENIGMFSTMDKKAAMLIKTKWEATCDKDSNFALSELLPWDSRNLTESKDELKAEILALLNPPEATNNLDEIVVHVPKRKIEPDL